MKVSPHASATRRTFAIISHPDAGKTTLTENLLYASGAIHLAGEVAARGDRRRTRSDWMKIERDRGISVSASVMTFHHRNLVFNLLDTPGHEDFSEDTYRTLTAVDSAIMVLDAAKGIEPQTLKLFEVCRLRDIPIFTFVNKLDRDAIDPFDLLEDVSDQLQLDTAPLYWPAASGARFSGMMNLRSGAFHRYKKGENEHPIIANGANNGAFTDLEPDIVETLNEEVELAREALPQFDKNAFLGGHLTPVVYGSALRKFGVDALLDTIAELAPAPSTTSAQKSGQSIEISPDNNTVSGFVFKVQANMDPNHRDRVAFVRLSSGLFKRGMRLKTANGKQITIHNPQMFLAQDREIAETAVAGDVIGVPNHGQLRVGDTLSETGDIEFKGIPNFAPEILRRARPKDPMKAKHLRRALENLSEEGVTQFFTPAIGSDMIVGAVGPLQIEVMAERVATEYKLDVVFETAPFNIARWLNCADDQIMRAFLDKNKSSTGTDIDGAPVYLGKNSWDVSYVEEKNPDIQFSNTKER